jgi:hypothetical protein
MTGAMAAIASIESFNGAARYVTELGLRGPKRKTLLSMAAYLYRNRQRMRRRVNPSRRLVGWNLECSVGQLQTKPLSEDADAQVRWRTD